MTETPDAAVQIARDEIHAHPGDADEIARDVVDALARAGWLHNPAKLREMAKVINEVIAHYHRYSELDETWLAETARRLRALSDPLGRP